MLDSHVIGFGWPACQGWNSNPMPVLYAWHWKFQIPRTNGLGETYDFVSTGWLSYISFSIKIQKLSHSFPPLWRNTSIGVCQCEVSQWESFLRNERNSMISPYESGFIDVKINKETFTFFSVALEEGKVFLHLNLFLLVVHKITWILRHFLFFPTCRVSSMASGLSWFWITHFSHCAWHQ